MSGSLKWFKYVADDSTEYNVHMDKSNAAIGGFADADDASDPNLPRGMTMRYVNLLHAASGSRRRLPIASTSEDIWTGVTNSAQLWLQGQATPGLASFEVTSRVGERKTQNPTLVDSGLVI
jgi:hypothetical protein